MRSSWGVWGGKVEEYKEKLQASNQKLDEAIQAFYRIRERIK